MTKEMIEKIRSKRKGGFGIFNLMDVETGEIVASTKFRADRPGHAPATITDRKWELNRKKDELIRYDYIQDRNYRWCRGKEIIGVRI